MYVIVAYEGEERVIYELLSLEDLSKFLAKNCRQTIRIEEIDESLAELFELSELAERREV